MKRHFIMMLAPALLAGLALGGCKDDSTPDAMATILDKSAVEFAAKDAAPESISLKSDGAWSVIEIPEWASVTPASGEGNVTISVAVQDNVSGGEVAAPRSGNLVIGGTKKIGQATLAIHQAGDRYAGTAAVALSAVAALADGSIASVKGAQAVAATASRVLISDGSGFALTDAALDLGASATVKGVKKTENGIAVITEADLLDVKAGSVTPPAAKDITSALDEFTGAGEYVSLQGVLAAASGGNYPVEVDAKVKVVVLSPVASLDFASNTHHLVVVTGYGFVADGTLTLVATAIEDKGVAKGQDLVAKWTFTTETRDINGPTFTGAEKGSNDIYTSDTDKTAGDGGRYVAAETGDAQLKYVNVDKSEIDVDNYSKRIIGKTGEPYVTGAWTGDYWLFEVNVSKTYKAGSTVHFYGVARSSAGGFKYWSLEIFDGGEWVPMTETKTVQVAGQEGDVVYTHEQMNTDYLDVDENYVTKSDISGKLQIRYKAMSSATAKNGTYKAKPDGGTHRFAGADKYTSPYIEISYER